MQDKNMSRDLAKEKNWQKIQAIWTALNRKKMLFTGLSVKTYIKNTLLGKKFNSSSINSGKWSAYCHHLIAKSFANLLEKHEIDSSSKVLIHPLTSPELIQLVRELGAKVVFFDINLDTLNFDPLLLQGFIAQNPVDLVIHTNFNGLVRELSEFADISKQSGLTNLFILQADTINLETWNFLENLSLGSVIINSPETFTKQELSELLDIKLEESIWFLSWFFEHRTRSILEYKLGSLEQNYTQFLEAILYLRLKQQQKYNFFTIFLSLFLNNYIITSKIQSDDEAKLQIIENYQQITNSAVPDIIFEIQNINNQVTPSTQIPNHKIDTDYKLDRLQEQKSNEKQTKIKNIYNSIRFKEASLIPKYFENREYTGYFFYGSQDLQINQKYTFGWNVDPQVLDFPNTKIIANEMIYITVSE